MEPVEGPGPDGSPEHEAAEGEAPEPSELGQPSPGPQAAPQVPDSFRKLVQYAQMDNICDDLDDTLLADIGARAKQEYEIDKRSRAEWLDKVERYKALALQKAEPKNYPFAKASNVIWPLLSMAANDFAAAAYPAIIQGRDVVKGIVVGEDNGKPVIGQDGKPVMDPSTQKPKVNQETMEIEKDQNGQPIMDPASAQPAYYEKPGTKQDRADKVANHMSWQLLFQDRNWQKDTDMLLRRLPIVGGAARKVWYDPGLKKNCSRLVAYENLVINYYARSFESAPRITEVFELYPFEIEEKVRRGEYRDFQYNTFGGSDKKGQSGGDDRDGPQVFLEQHRRWDLDGDGYAEPYVVVLHESTGQVVRITAGFDLNAETIEIKEGEEGPQIVRIDRKRFYVPYGFIPNPDSSVYPLGWGHLLGPINEAINTSINQMFDGAHLQNAGGGFIGSQLSMHSGQVKFKVGEYKVVNTMGSNIRDAIYPMQFPGPSPVLLQLLSSLFDAGKEFGGMRDVTQGNTSPASTDPATLYAIMEQGQKVFKDIYKRIYAALNEEFKLLYDINAKCLPEQGVRYQMGDTFETVTKADYQRGAGVEPIGDPSMITDVQRMGRAQFLMSFKDDPLINQVEVRKRALGAVNMDGIENLVVENQTPSAMDIVTMEQAKANVDKTRADEMESHTAALVNMMKAKQIANEADSHFLDKQMDFTKLHLEGVRNLIMATQQESRMAEIREKARLTNAQRAKK
jgi:chaperonin GroES